MVAAKLAALCKDSGLIDKRFPVQRVEISFSRLKPKVTLALFFASTHEKYVALVKHR